MVSPAAKEEVRARLRRAESEHNVKVLLAIESGSRAWGFASPNSDYDARFIYVNKPEWYLSVGLEEQRDVIEYPIVDDMDINGWDLRKALRLFWKSNPSFVEWIQSNIIYEHTGCFHETAKALLPQVYSVEKGIHHYRSMAKTNFRQYLQNAEVPLKKYFYVLRPLLAVRWLNTFGTPAPIEFSTLCELIDDPQLLKAVDELLELKRNAPEMGLYPQIKPIQHFIEQELERLESLTPASKERITTEPLLSDLFRKALKEAWE
ncbi:nucleotidyltransferase domain-containing protein [Ectopseudomonas mendocina]|uniref:Nucleotidyltransferase domain-containing protein n=1 Tax=Ectopseudomonas mendocina TaxID=300 RepID=A0ABZ2RKC3_ECTME